MTTSWRVIAAGMGAIATAATIGSGRPEGRPLYGLGQTPTEVVEVTAERFSFTPSEIRVKAGTRLEIRLQSDDTDHGFRIPDTEIDVRIPKRNRGTISVTYEATKPGRYTFQCSHVCGAGHSFMRGEIVVTE